MSMHLHYIINARIPHVRAYGIQIAKMCEAFAEAGAVVTVVIPRTLRSRLSMREENALPVDIKTAVLPGIDWYDKGRIGLLASSIVFMISSFVYLLMQKWRGRLRTIYTVDMDTFSYALLPLVGVPCYIETHGAKRPTFVNRFFFRRVTGVIATNREIRNSLVRTFGISAKRIIEEPNGVDEHEFVFEENREQARAALKLPQEASIALYVGRFYEWKGLDIIVDAACLTPSVSWYVIGGVEEQFRSMTHCTELPSNLHVMGDKHPNEVPQWLAAADALLLLGTDKNELSSRFTAPMKVYEYAYSQRPVVASATPALKSIVSDQQVLFYAPDDVHDLVEKTRRAVRGGEEVDRLIHEAQKAARAHTWRKRAERIMAFIDRI